MAHRYWRLLFSESVSNNFIEVAEIQFRATVGGADQATGGTELASSRLSIAFRAFDDDEFTVWFSNSGDENGAYIGYDFGTAVDVAEVAVTVSDFLSAAPKSWDIQYSDNGTDWTTVISYGGQTGWGVRETRYYVTVEAAPSLNFNFIAAERVESDPLPAINLAFSMPVPGSLALSRVPVINFNTSLVTPIDLVVQTTSLNFAVVTPGNPIIIPTGTPTRIYRIKFNINGSVSYVAPATITVRYRYGAASYLSVSLHNPSSTLITELTTAIAASQIATMTVQAGWRTGNSDGYQDQLTADIEDVTTDQGATSFSATLTGYNNTTATLVPKELTVGGAEYIRSGNVAGQWRGVFNSNIAPGDKLTLEDASTLIVGLISYTIQSDSAQMDISELTDADLLAQLPW